MAFAFNTEKIQPKVMDRLELLNAQEELNNAWMNLTDAQKSMEEVCEVMENIQASVDIITKYGVAGVEQLNIDGSLEALCGVEAKLITAEKAMEGLGEAAKDLWNKFVGWVKKIWDNIKKWFQSIFSSDTAAAADASKNADALSKLAPEEQKEFLDKTPNKAAATESMSLGELKTNIIVKYEDMAQYIISFEACLDLLRNLKVMLPSDANIKDMIGKDPEGFVKNLQDSIVQYGKKCAQYKSDIIKITFNEETLACDAEVIYAPAAEDKSLSELGWTIDNAIKFNKWYNATAQNKANIDKLSAKATDTINAWIIMVADTLNNHESEEVRKFSSKLINLLKLQCTQNLKMLQLKEKINGCLKAHVKYFRGNLPIHD